MSEAIDYSALPEQPVRNLTRAGTRPDRNQQRQQVLRQTQGAGRRQPDAAAGHRDRDPSALPAPGKSTLLRAINHLGASTEGFIRIDGDYVGYRRKGNRLYELKEKAILRQRINVGYVFQNFNLFPHLTVLENIIEAPVVHKIHSASGRRRSPMSCWIPSGCATRRMPTRATLSGGQQQRASPSRARWR